MSTQDQDQLVDEAKNASDGSSGMAAETADSCTSLLPSTGGFTCPCCQRNAELLVNGFCNECATTRQCGEGGLDLFRQLVRGKNALRQLDVFACNDGEHDAGCECFWEQCEAWAKMQDTNTRVSRGTT